VGIGAGLYVYDVVVKTFTFAISSTDEFLLLWPLSAVEFEGVLCDFCKICCTNIQCYVNAIKAQIFLN